MKIGQLARRAGVGVETVRFYEREGLLQEPPRRDSGYREYALEDLVRLRFIRQAKALGFSLPEIQELLSLRSGSETPCHEVQRKIESKLVEIRRKIHSLEKLEKVLEEFAVSCATQDGPSECPLLEALEGASKETDEDRRSLARIRSAGGS